MAAAIRWYLFHGGGSTLEATFGRVLTSFAKLIWLSLLDLQAHGRTADRDQPSSFEQDADDVAGLLKHLKIGRADVFGFSNGASTTLQLAIRRPSGGGNKIRSLPLPCIRRTAHTRGSGIYESGAFDHMPQMLKYEHLRVNR